MTIEYKNFLNSLSLNAIKKFIKTYMAHVKIVMTRKGKDELIKHIMKHTQLKGDKIVLKKASFDMPEEEEKEQDKEEDKEEDDDDYKNILMEIRGILDEYEKYINILFRNNIHIIFFSDPDYVKLLHKINKKVKEITDPDKNLIYKIVTSKNMASIIVKRNNRDRDDLYIVIFRSEENTETRLTDKNIEEFEQKKSKLKTKSSDAIERYKAGTSILKYSVFDNGKFNKNNDKKFDLEFKNKEFKNVEIFNKVKDMENKSGIGFLLEFGYDEKKGDQPIKKGFNILKNEEQFDNNHYIIADINDNPIHISKIDAEDETRGRLYIAFVSVSVDFQGRKLTEETFMLLWAYFKKFDIFDKYKINEIYLAYASTIPVFTTYIKLIEMAGFKSPYWGLFNKYCKLDELDKDMKMLVQAIIRNMSFIISFEFQKNAKIADENKNNTTRLIVQYAKSIKNISQRIKNKNTRVTNDDILNFCFIYKQLYNFDTVSQWMKSETLSYIYDYLKIYLSDNNNLVIFLKKVMEKGKNDNRKIKTILEKIGFDFN